MQWFTRRPWEASSSHSCDLCVCHASTGQLPQQDGCGSVILYQNKLSYKVLDAMFSTLATKVQETEKRDSESARPPGSQAMERVRRTRWSKWSRCCKAGCLVWLLAALESTKSESFAGPRRALLAALPFFSSAKANAEVTIAPTQLPPRDARKDEEFAKGMAYGMVDYERAVSKKKRALFSKLWGLLPPNPVVVEVGIGSFPNALYFGSKSAPSSMDIVGVDPNEYMERYAIDNAKKVGLLAPERGNSFRFTKGIAEALPLPGQSADAAPQLQTPIMQERREASKGGVNNGNSNSAWGPSKPVSKTRREMLL